MNPSLACRVDTSHGAIAAVLFAGFLPPWRDLGLAGGPWPLRPAELKHGLIPWAQLADVAGQAGLYRVARTLRMNG